MFYTYFQCITDRVENRMCKCVTTYKLNIEREGFFKDIYFSSIMDNLI